MIDSLQGTLLAGRYRVLVPIAKGGMGAVYEALDEHTRARVAVKLIRSEFLQDVVSIERFKREAKISAHVRHPSLVATLDVSLDSDPSFFVMELLDGPTVGELLSHADRLPWQRAVRIGRDVLEGLVALHAAGAIHRDIKPSNVMLVREPAAPSRERAKLIDFGVIRVAPETGQDSLTWSGNVVGTPSFMAPEQYAGEQIDARSDLYSVGLLCAKMLRGAHAVLRVPLASSATLEPWPADVPTALARLVERLVRERPEDRPSTAAQALAELVAIDEAHRAQSSPSSATSIATDSSYGGAQSADTPRSPALAPTQSTPTLAPNATVLTQSTPNTGSRTTQSIASRAPTERKRTKRAWPWVVGAVLLGSATSAAIAVKLTRDDREETPDERAVATTTQIAAPNVALVQSPQGQRYEPMGTRLRFVYGVPDAENMRQTMLQSVELPMKQCIDPATHRLGRHVIDVVVQVDRDGATTHINSTANQTTPAEESCVLPILRRARWPSRPEAYEVRLIAHTDL